jgi:hypothetical protein
MDSGFVEFYRTKFEIYHPIQTLDFAQRGIVLFVTRRNNKIILESGNLLRFTEFQALSCKISL